MTILIDIRVFVIAVSQIKIPFWHGAHATNARTKRMHKTGLLERRANNHRNRHAANRVFAEGKISGGVRP
jgi:hypothetical protein